MIKLRTCFEPSTLHVARWYSTVSEYLTTTRVSDFNFMESSLHYCYLQKVAPGSKKYWKTLERLFSNVCHCKQSNLSCQNCSKIITTQHYIVSYRIRFGNCAFFLHPRSHRLTQLDSRLTRHGPSWSSSGAIHGDCAGAKNVSGAGRGAAGHSQVISFLGTFLRPKPSMHQQAPISMYISIQYI